MTGAEETGAIDAGSLDLEARRRLLAAAQSDTADAALFSQLERALAQTQHGSDEFLELLYGASRQAWILDQRNASATRARDYALKLVKLAPQRAAGHFQLGLAHLTRKEYRDAEAAFSVLPREFKHFRALARHLMAGKKTVEFNLAGEVYAFDLSTHNASAIETSAYHSVATLHEWEELQFLAKHVANARCIVEVGVLVGNHTAFFLKNFSADRLVLIDADPANHPYIRRTIEHNLQRSPPPAVQLECTYVGGRSGQMMSFAGSEVPVRRLDEVVTGPVDFLKIDVDGGEVEVLEGAAGVVESRRPAIMIETARHTNAPVLAQLKAWGYEPRRVFEHGSYSNTFLTTA